MKFKRLHTPEQIQKLIEFHNANSDFVVIDVETTSKDARTAELIDIQIGGSGSEDEAVIFSGDYAKLILKLRSDIFLVAHNYKYDAQVLFRHGVDLLSYAWQDTLLIGHLVDENRPSHSLGSYVKEYWSDPYKETFWTKYESYEEATEDDKVDYSCRDIIYTGRLFSRLRDELSRQFIPDSLVKHVHCLQTSLLKTEIEGIKVDTEYLADLGVKVKRRINELEPQMRGCVKDEIEIIELETWGKEIEKRKTAKGKAAVQRPQFSFESNSQLQSLLYGALRLPAQRNAKTKRVSTDFESLEAIKDTHPVVGRIQQNRELQKVYTSYIEGTTERLLNGRIYPEFRVNGTVTGRLASANPNMQQLPREGGIRGIYVPDTGHVLITADYASLEIYIAANFTKDPSLLKVVLDGKSMHDVTAESLGIDRNLAKTLNFAEGYGCSHFKVAKILGISEKEALKVHDNYWRTYSGQKRLMQECYNKVDTRGEIVTPWGRKRRFEIKKRSPWDKAYRQAWNFLIQSSGADCCNRAFYLYSEHLQKTGRGRAWFPIHDEIVAEVKPEFAQEEISILCEIMSKVGDDIGLEIPLKAQPTEPGDRWND